MSTQTHEHDVHDRVIVLAGAGGLAAATAARLGAGGAKLVIGDLSIDAAEAAADAARANGGEARAVQLDISDQASVNALIASAMSEFGRIDGLLNIAADIRPQNLGRDSDAVDIPLEVWQHTIDVNLTGYLLTTRAAIPHMLAGGGGSIVNIISGAVYIGEPVRLAYAVTKAGITALTRHIASRWGSEGIRANSLAPGGVLTKAMMANITQEQRDASLATIPNTRLGKPDDIAAMAIHLLSEDGAWIQGQSISVDGGLTMRP
ncbi:SDR family NAD(P)-dependent oxidoreductase [Microbacterium paludicola]|uniref:SDR family NAD(P)-dependent oxidoreductase n=1 Tax=Microbacterium paludicola TaxID=300019 RepID=UPI0016431777|nr:SDR family oxidoreductase [Microbacterium paludicola]